MRGVLPAEKNVERAPDLFEAVRWTLVKSGWVHLRRVSVLQATCAPLHPLANALISMSSH